VQDLSKVVSPAGWRSCEPIRVVAVPLGYGPESFQRVWGAKANDLAPRGDGKSNGNGKGEKQIPFGDDNQKDNGNGNNNSNNGNNNNGDGDGDGDGDGEVRRVSWRRGPSGRRSRAPG
jgi:hypothetical protein